MAKTYVDAGVTIVSKAQKYLVRWQPKLVQGASAGQILALTNLITCIAQFLNEWHKATPIN